MENIVIPRKIRQAFRPVACEILTDVLQILVPRLFVPLNLRVTLVTLYQGPPTPGNIASPRQSCGGCRVARPPAGDFWGFFGPHLAPPAPQRAPLGLVWAPCGRRWSPFEPHVGPIGVHLGPISAPLGSFEAK